MPRERAKVNHTANKRAKQSYRFEAPEAIKEAGDVRFFMPPPDAERFWVDLTNLRWISPIGIVGMLALARKAESLGLSETTISTPADAVVTGYLTRVGFFDALEEIGAAVEDALKSGEHGEPIRPCLPATHVRSEIEMERAANSLEEVLVEAGAHPHTLHAVYLVTTEVTNNAWQHGSECYVLAQTHSGQSSGTPGVHIAIADFGPGFKASLSARYPVETEVEAIVKACEEGVSSTGDPRRGLGLWHVLDAVDRHPGATLSIVSHDGWLERSNSDFRLRQGPLCSGVFVTAYFPFD